MSDLKNILLKGKKQFNKLLKRNTQIHCTDLDAVNNNLISIWMEIDGKQHSLIIRPHEKVDILYARVSYITKSPITDYYISDGVHILSAGNTFYDYNIARDRVLFFHRRLFGGARDNTSIFHEILGKLIPPSKHSQAREFVDKLIEDVTMLAHHLVKANDKRDYIFAIVNFAKLRIDGPLMTEARIKSLINGLEGRTKMLIDYLQNLFKEEFEVQGIEETLGSIKSYLNQYDAIKNSVIFQKLYKFLMYALSLSLFDKVGITFDSLKYTRVEEEAIKRKFYAGPDFVHCLLDTVTFLCERGVQCMKTGQMDTIFHSGNAYEEWFNTASKLIMDAKFLNNPEPHGIDPFNFLADLLDTIEKGNCIYAHASALGDFEKRTVKKVLNDLLLIKGNETTKRAAQKERKSPFSILLYGGSSVGKSTFSKMLFYQYANIFGLNKGDEFLYTRSPFDEYWTGFNSSQWAIRFDDCAFRHPNKASDIDSSIVEILQANNNACFTPPQAALEDKGKTPLKARFMVASTNTETLHAVHYFANPLAVRRRFPYVLQIEPKFEYSKNVCMLDPSSLPASVDGEFPDYWKITVKHIIPKGTTIDKQRAELCEDYIFENIDDFIVWFSEKAIEHERIQTLAMNCDANMANVTTCSQCFLVDHKCECLQLHAGESLEAAAIAYLNFNGYYERREQEAYNESYFAWLCLLFKHFVLNIYCKYYILRSICNYFYSYPLVRAYVKTYLVSLLLTAEDHRIFFRAMGERVGKRLGQTKFLLGIISMLGASYGLYKFYKNCVEVFVEKENVELQGNMNATPLSQTIGRAPQSKTVERENVWYQDEYVTTTFDVSPQSRSYKGVDRDIIIDKLHRNCVYFESSYMKPDVGITVRVNRAVCVKGRIYMTNNHGLPEFGDIKLTIISSVAKDGVNANITINITQSEIKRYPQYDIAFVELSILPPKKDITTLFAMSTLQGKHTGYYLGKNRDGSNYYNKVDAIRLDKDYYCERFSRKMSTWFGIAEVSTTQGDCGALLVSDTAWGTIVLGLHYLGSNNTKTIGSLQIDQDFILKACEEINTFCIEAGEPKLVAETAAQILGKLHNKSTIRYTPNGTASVYGSFSGFKPRHTSKVTQTLICKTMLQEGYSITCGKPIMSGWAPWYNALSDMVRPVTELDNSILLECTQSFTNDILSKLTQEQLDQVFVYDDVTALNGAPGVSYIDKMKRNTSAGNPWKKSKKYFLSSIAPVGNILDPVEASPEIMSRVSEGIDTYLNKRRVCPVFCAHLKDEAIPFKKIQACKTRVFTGAPMDWSIINRKYCLSIVKLIQENKFLFESGPGTIAQSIEWGQIRDYITTFGDDRLIAGDYGKFDKRMPASVILAAFDIIIAICKAAGYTEEELLVVYGIAEDTAFPLVEFNGDLVQFNGTNPSGHPLTVIINGLANSLYMRYCYHVLNPNHESTSFKKNVHLMTYGDDNCMGVNKSCGFFNHTAIQDVLASVDIVYTMADKEAASIPYIHIDEVSFLKRTWLWDDDVEGYLCPLEHESINKMLTMCVPSKTITMSHQSIEVISTALREYFFYGKKTFEIRRAMFERIIIANGLQNYVEDSTLPLWQELRDDYWRASERL